MYRPYKDCTDLQLVEEKAACLRDIAEDAGFKRDAETALYYINEEWHIRHDPDAPPQT